MTLIIPGANITAQWYGDSFPGTRMPTIEKFLLHSTETNSWPGYGGGASMPTATYHPRLRAIRQHQDAERSARALKDPSGTPVHENRDNVLQVEIVAYSDFGLARDRGGLWIGDLTDKHMEDLARIHLWLNKVKGTPLRTDVAWAPGAKTSAGTAGKRLTSSQYDAARGVLAHFHASGNSHWDVGGFDIDRYMRALTWLQDGEDDMPSPAQWTAADWAAFDNWFAKSFDADDPTPSKALTNLRRAAWNQPYGDGSKTMYQVVAERLDEYLNSQTVEGLRQSQANAEALKRIEELLTEPEPTPNP